MCLPEFLRTLFHIPKSILDSPQVAQALGKRGLCTGEVIEGAAKWRVFVLERSLFLAQLSSELFEEVLTNLHILREHSLCRLEEVYTEFDIEVFLF